MSDSQSIPFLLIRFEKGTAICLRRCTIRVYDRKSGPFRRKLFRNKVAQALRGMLALGIQAIGKIVGYGFVFRFRFHVLNFMSRQRYDENLIKKEIGKINLKSYFRVVKTGFFYIAMYRILIRQFCIFAIIMKVLNPDLKNSSNM